VSKQIHDAKIRSHFRKQFSERKKKAAVGGKWGKSKWSPALRTGHMIVQEKAKRQRGLLFSCFQKRRKREVEESGL